MEEVKGGCLPREARRFKMNHFLQTAQPETGELHGLTVTAYLSLSEIDKSFPLTECL